MSITQTINQKNYKLKIALFTLTRRGASWYLCKWLSVYYCIEERCRMLNITEYEAMAMLDLQDDERVMLSRRIRDLAGGLTAFERIDTDEVESLVTVLGLHNIFREDAAEKLLSRDEILASAPEQYDGYFQVPGTLE
jgi:aspartyl/glutamyl-tRNA(Asn/Gln) amidotransferase C subunit